MGDYVKLTDAEFDSKTAKGNWIVDLWAEWCGPCKVLGPKIEQVATELKGKLHVGKLNIDENPSTPEKFGVMSIPTMLFIKDGVVVGTKIGGQYSVEDLKKFAKEFLGI